MADYATQESWHTLPDGHKVYTKTWKVCRMTVHRRKSFQLIFLPFAARIPANRTGPLHSRIL